MDRKEKAVRFFSDELHCSQSVLAAFADECGITENMAFRLGSCFGSGMRKGNVCGACVGALMVLGLLFGEEHNGDPEERQRTNRITVMMMDRFIQANGTCICNELLGCDITTPEGVQYARENGLFRDFCPKMVMSAVDILEEIIEEIGKIVNFGSAAMLNSTYKKVKQVADKAGIAMDEKEFHCRGEFKGIHKGRPDENDIADAVQFVKQYK